MSMYVVYFNESSSETPKTIVEKCHVVTNTFYAVELVLPSSQLYNQSKVELVMSFDLTSLTAGSVVYLAILSIDVLDPVESVGVNTATVTTTVTVTRVYSFYVTETETVTNVTTMAPSLPGAANLMLLIAFGIMIGSTAFVLLRR